MVLPALCASLDSHHDPGQADLSSHFLTYNLLRVHSQETRQSELEVQSLVLRGFSPKGGNACQCVLSATERRGLGRRRRESLRSTSGLRPGGTDPNSHLCFVPSFLGGLGQSLSLEPRFPHL